MDTFEILSQLCSAAGVSGAEDSAAKTAAKLLDITPDRCRKEGLPCMNKY